MATIARKLFQTLIHSAIQRCRLSGSLCRLTISLKCFHDSDPPTVQISISDTGIGSSIVEFQGPDFEVGCTSSSQWDGMLSVTTTGINDKVIHRHHFNLRESIFSSMRLTSLQPMHKKVGTFSGTEICFSTAQEASVNGFVAWVVCFVQKILVLKAPDVLTDLRVEHINNAGSRCECLLQKTDDVSLPISISSTERLLSGFEEYVTKHGNVLSKKCEACFTSSEHLKAGKGLASSTGSIKNTWQTAEAVILISAVSSQPCSWKEKCLTTQILFFQDFSPTSLPMASLNALTSINWQNYGLRLRGSFVDDDGNAMLEWENLSFADVNIAIHSYCSKVLQGPLKTSPDKNLVKKAVKMALDDLKEKHGGLFLSSHSVKVREYAPDLSRTIAGLILSSNDLNFQDECIALLGMSSVDAGKEGRVESCIREKLIGIIEMNDCKPKGYRDNAPLLFECESLFEEDCPDEEKLHDEENIVMLDF